MSTLFIMFVWLLAIMMSDISLLDIATLTSLSLSPMPDCLECSQSFRWFKGSFDLVLITLRIFLPILSSRMSVIGRSCSWYCRRRIITVFERCTASFPGQ